MKTRIYTDRERAALAGWLTGRIHRRGSPLLHNTLLRTRRNQAKLTLDVTFMVLTLRRLSVGAPHRRPGDLETTLAIAPMTITALDAEAYATHLPLIRRDEDAANDDSRPPEERLNAARRAIDVALSMARGDGLPHGASRDPPNPRQDSQQDPATPTR
jgi:hypothetical protein